MAVPIPTRQQDRLALGLALVAAFLALAISLLVLLGGLRARQTALEGLEQAIVRLEALCADGAGPVTFPISQTIRFQSDIALPAGIVIPFKGEIPIDTQFQLETFAGGPVLNLPLKATVPVDTRIPLPAGITIPVDASVPFRQDIPIDLCGGENGDLVGEALRALRDLREGL